MTRNPSTSLARVAVRLLEDVPQLRVREVAAHVGLSEQTVYIHWRAAHPGEPPRKRRYTDEQLEACIEPFAALCDDMLDCLQDGMTAGEWLAAVRRRCLTLAVRSDSPAAEARRFFRGMERLVGRGEVARDGKARANATYRRIR